MTGERLTVLHINKMHHILGGAEFVYFTTSELLEKHGHKSIFFSVRHQRNIPAETEEYFVPCIELERNKGLFNYIKASLNVFYSFKSRKYLARLLDNYSIDIAHIHNIHRQMSPSILHELKKRNIPVVMTLHEHKMVCPSFLLLAHGQTCEACRNGRYYNAIRVRCVKGSFMRSLLAMLEEYLHFYIMDVYKNVDVFIAPSMFLKNKHEEMGFRKKLVHLPYPLDLKKYNNFYLNTPFNSDHKVRFAYFGRLVKEKGVLTLMDAISLLSQDVKDRIELRIIGDGPARKEMEAMVNRGGHRVVHFTGFLEGERLYKEVSSAHIIVIPSEWYENYPVSVMEAFALGKPVIGSRIGGIPEMVKDSVTGLTFNPGDADDLCRKMEELIMSKDDIIRMGMQAREFAERVFDAEFHYPKLMRIYEMALNKHRI